MQLANWQIGTFRKRNLRLTTIGTLADWNITQHPAKKSRHSKISSLVAV